MSAQMQQAQVWIERAFKTRKGIAVVLVVLWAVEIFVIQEATLREHHYYASYQPVLHRGVRAALDLLVCGLLVTVLHRWLLGLCFGGGLIFAGVVLSFENYSGRPLSATMITSTAGEGASVANAGFAMLPTWAFILIATFALKLVLLRRLGRYPASPSRHRWSRAGRLVATYCLIIVTVNFYKPFRLLLGWESVGGIGSVYGYTPTWVAELVLLDPEEILERALTRVGETSNRLGEGVETDFPATDKLVFLQVESLDAATLTHEVGGQPVTPRLRQLAETSMTYLIRSEKKTGSCDADFTSIMCGLPSVDMPNYKIQGFPYEDSFIGELQRWGFVTTAVHNVKGAFFNRREAFTNIDFNRMFFLEELTKDQGLPFDDWAVLDHDMLNWVAEDLGKSTRKDFSLVITATSHIPFHYTPAKYRTLYPGNDDMVPSYLDAVHYVDSAIGTFVENLPKGTVVVIYGNHGAMVSSDEYGYKNLDYEKVGLVPFLIHQVGSDLQSGQRTKDAPLATSGELTLLDMMTYVQAVMRRQYQASRGAVPL